MPPRGERAVIAVATFNHHPGCVAGAGLAQRLLADLDELVVVLETVPVVGRHAPGGLGVGLQRLEAFACSGLGQVKPVLHHQRTLGHQHVLQVSDALQPLGEAGFLLVPHHMVHDGAGVPGAKQDANAAFGRQHLPEAAHLGELLGLGVSGVKGLGTDVARVHPLVEQVHHLALAGTVNAVDEDDHREVAILKQLVLCREQRLTQLRLFLAVFLAADAVADFGRFEHGDPPFGSVLSAAGAFGLGCAGRAEASHAQGRVGD